MQHDILHPPENRLVSIDALRGLTMFFIIGGERIFTSIIQIWPNPVTEALSKNMEHAGWERFNFYDQIFLLFLFLAGLLIPLAPISKRSLKLKVINALYLIYRRLIAMEIDTEYIGVLLEE
jgi:predicted acyltransferase